MKFSALPLQLQGRAGAARLRTGDMDVHFAQCDGQLNVIEVWFKQRQFTERA